MPPIVVTTSRTKVPSILGRAQSVAETIGAPYRKRRGNIQDVYVDEEWAYVISAEREEIVHQTGRSFFVHAGLFGPKTQEGARHPLVRAVAPGGRCDRIVDATLGLAQDALHLAYVTGAEVVGTEASPIVHTLVTAGLARLRLAEGVRPFGVDVAARRVTARQTLADAHLQTLDDNSADVVYLDPMMPVPGASAPGFDLFRAFARPNAFEAEFFREALRVAPRVIVKTRGNQMGSPCEALAFERIHRSKSLAYWELVR